MTWLQPVSLRGPGVDLEPLDHRHCDDLVEAVNDGALWTLWYTSIPQPDTMRAEIDRRLTCKPPARCCSFAVIDNATGRAVGMTTYMNADPVNRHLEIGSTWYRKSVQRTILNTQCKLLLLTHAF